MKSIINLKERLYGLILFMRIMGKIQKFDLHSRSQFLQYFERSCREPATQYEKLELLKSFSKTGDYWIETGTFVGYTTRGLSEGSSHVYSLEPSTLYYDLASSNLANRPNITVVNRTSEEGLLEVIDRVPKGSHVNLWLDGHYSDGETFLGNNLCPIEAELEIIKSRLSHVNVTIFIDDFRLFGSDFGYPTKDFLVNWSKVNEFSWTVEKDIFIMSK
jgi:hypothetical protein